MRAHLHRGIRWLSERFGLTPAERDWVLILLIVATVWLGLRYQRLLREQPVPVPDPISELDATPAPPEPTESSPF